MYVNLNRDSLSLFLLVRNAHQAISQQRRQQQRQPQQQTNISINQADLVCRDHIKSFISLLCTWTELRLNRAPYIYVLHTHSLNSQRHDNNNC